MNPENPLLRYSASLPSIFSPAQASGAAAVSNAICPLIDFIWNIPDTSEAWIVLAPLPSVYIKPADSLVPVVRKPKFLHEPWGTGPAFAAHYCSHEAAVAILAVLLLVTMKAFSCMFLHYRQSRLEQTKSTSGSCGAVVSVQLSVGSREEGLAEERVYIDWLWTLI